MDESIKAMEAPEKIYIHVRANKKLGTTWHGKKITNSDIEYVHKDAFIEKAMKFLYDYNKNMVEKHGARAVLGCSGFTINVDDFRKYMKGE